MNLNSQSSTTTNSYASGLKVTITQDNTEDEKSKLMSRHEMGTMITRLTNKVNALEEAVERVRLFANDAIDYGQYIIRAEDVLKALDGKEES